MIVPISESSERLPPELNNIGAKINKAIKPVHTNQRPVFMGE
jgi:hypothetical protein